MACGEKYPIPDSGPEATRDRAVGAMLGCAIGDALASALVPVAHGGDARLDDLAGGAPVDLKAGQWTAPTAMSLALASSLIACGGLDEDDLLQRFADWFTQGEYACTGSCIGIDAETQAALARRGVTASRPGEAEPVTSASLSLARLAPVAVQLWQTPDLLHEAAARQSRTTHVAHEVASACVTLAELLAAAIAGSQPAWGTTQARLRAPAGNALAVALQCLCRADSFAEAVLAAAEAGNVTVAAVTGQLAGAYYGKAGIHSCWLEQLAWREPIESLALELTTPRGWYPA